MQKIVLSVTALVFFIWIMPLGFLIRPAQEKAVCNGQRAICMCSHALMSESKTGKAIFKSNNPTSQNESSSAGSPNKHFLMAQNTLHKNDRAVFDREDPSLIDLPLFLHSIEHVPKV